MATLTRDEITQALEQLGKLAHSTGYTVELLVVGGSAMVLLYNARQLLQSLTGEQDQVWKAITPYLVPGEELKAQYAFLDLWEALYGTD